MAINSACIIAACAAHAHRSNNSVPSPDISTREYYNVSVPVIRRYKFESLRVPEFFEGKYFQAKSYPCREFAARKTYVFSIHHSKMKTVDQEALRLADVDTIYWDGIRTDCIRQRIEEIRAYQRPDIRTYVDLENLDVE